MNLSRPLTRALLCAAALLSTTPFASEPVTAKFTVTDGDAYEVLVRQGGRQLPCPEVVTPERPCQLQLDKGPATVVATGSPSFEFDYQHQGSTTHTLSFRRTWPKWVGASLIIAAAASFAITSLKASKCGSRNLSDQSECRSAYVGIMFGVPLLALGLPAFIWGLFTGNRTVSEAL